MVGHRLERVLVHSRRVEGRTALLRTLSMGFRGEEIRGHTASVVLGCASWCQLQRAPLGMLLNLQVTVSQLPGS